MNEMAIDDSAATDDSVFPDPVYRDTVLAPLFDGVKKHYAEAMFAINQAHLVMLGETTILPTKTVSAIAIALKEIESNLNLANLEYTGEHEDYFFLVEAQLRQRLGQDQGGMLHTARSRNDMDHTVFKMALRGRCDHLLTKAITLAQTILNRASNETATVIVAYTHGQPAQPSTFAHYLSAILEVLIGDINRLLQARQALDLCPMGAAAITTTGFSIDRHQVADLLGFVEPKRNSYGCIASVDYITVLYSNMKLLFVHLGRVIQDLAFWSSFEVGQLRVPNSLVQVSSIMPQKRNPVPIEHLRHLASVTAGRCDMMVNTMHNTPFTDMNDSEGDVQAAGYSAFDSAGRVLALLNSLLSSVNIDKAAVARNASAACITITELADSLVRDEQLSFRQAHSIAADTAKQVISQDIALHDGYSSFLSAYQSALNRKCSMSELRFREVVSLDYFISVRDRYGGPGQSSMDEALDFYRSSLVSLDTKIAMGPIRIQKANDRRRSLFDTLCRD